MEISRRREILWIKMECPSKAIIIVVPKALGAKEGNFGLPMAQHATQHASAGTAAVIGWSYQGNASVHTNRDAWWRGILGIHKQVTELRRARFEAGQEESIDKKSLDHHFLNSRV